MGAIAWIVLGAVAGFIAEHLTGKGPDFCWPPSSGSSVPCLAGSSPRRCSGYPTLDAFFNMSTWLTAIIGAVVLFLLFGAFRGRGRRSRRA
jgi:uncharacterized membrane protein YeaQ/YmgE (transglycosylase-associated protein family)